MKLAKRVAAVVVPVGLVVGGVAYGVSHHHAPHDGALGECRARMAGLTVVLTDVQARNASLISAIAIRRGMPAHAATIALATALQESKLYDLQGGDRDSVGLFQQRPSQGWGTRRQILNPVHSTNSFYDALAKVPGYDVLPVTQAAQDVQHSGFPSAYATYASDARSLASALTGYSPAAFWCDLPRRGGQPTPVTQRAQALRAGLAPAFGSVPLQAARGGRLEVTASSAPYGWSVACFLVAHAERLGISTVTYQGREWSTGSGNRGWRRVPTGDSASAVVVGA